jgi:hypothetical protein
MRNGTSPTLLLMACPIAARVVEVSRASKGPEVCVSFTRGARAKVRTGLGMDGGQHRRLASSLHDLSVPNGGVVWTSASVRAAHENRATVILTGPHTLAHVQVVPRRS